jgi:hypothetical protein
MSCFTKTIGGVDPWTMPSDGVNGKYILLSARMKKWEKREYQAALRREAKKIIRESLGE